MVRTGVRRRQQHEHQIGRALINGFKVNRFLQADETAYRPRQRLDARVGNSDPLAHAG